MPWNQLKMNRQTSVLLLAVFNTWCAQAKELSDIETLTTQPIRCTYERAFDMYGAHCAGLRLNKLPNLKAGIEILDFSDNKLQELDSNTLSSYTSIKFLYLSENQIFNIEEDALTYLTDLQTLDLSKNVILNIPSSILKLPSLRKLYLNGNPLIHMSLDGLAANKDIRAPLEHLDLSECKIKRLPDWGLLPNLMIYNISLNPLASLPPKHFAVMCNLLKVDLTKSIDEIRLCNLRSAISWFQDKRIHFALDDYSKLNNREFEKCPMTEDFVALNVTYSSCKSKDLQIPNAQSISRRTWLTICGGLAGFLVGFILLLYLIHRYNVLRMQNAELKKTPTKDGDKKATAMLLNNIS